MLLHCCCATSFWVIYLLSLGLVLERETVRGREKEREGGRVC